MKKIVIKSISLKDWKSLNLKIEMGEKTIVKGRNGIGKSSLQAAWNWLLTGYTTPTAQKNHELFDNRVELSPDTPKAIVEAVIEIDGCEFKLEKRAECKFTRKRGSCEWEKASSDNYVTLIDNIEYPATKFKDWIEANIAPTDMLVYNLSGEFFANLCEEDKNKARKVLEGIVGEIKEEDLYGDFSIISEDLKKYSVEQIIEAKKNEKQPLEDRLREIPTTIATHENILSVLKEIDFDSVVEEISAKREEISKIDNTLLGAAESIKPIIEQRNEILRKISEVRSEIEKQRIDFNAPFNERMAELKAKRMSIVSTNSQIKERNIRAEYEYNKKAQSLEVTNKQIDALTLRRENLLNKRDEVKARVFISENCAYCGQELPQEKVQELQESFNAQKEKDLESIIAEGKSVRETLDILFKERLEIMKYLNNGITVEPEVSIEDIQSEIVMLEKTKLSFEDSEIYKTLFKEIEMLEGSIPEIPKQDNKELTDKKKVILDEIEELSQKLGMRDRIEELTNSISVLKQETRNIGNKIADIEKVIDICRDYIEERAQAISDKINGFLTYCKIQMWQTQKNGERIPACIITSPEGVKYSTLNNSNRIKTCISLQEMFNQHFGIQMPIFVDEASVFDSHNLPKVNGQSVFLYAGDNEKIEVLI